MAVRCMCSDCNIQKTAWVNLKQSPTTTQTKMLHLSTALFTHTRTRTHTRARARTHAHGARIQGNELADTLAKETAMNADITESYNKVPRSVMKSELNAISLASWQREWDQTTKGQITKAYFPTVTERLNT